MDNTVEKIKLRNGYEMPCIGFGTWDMKDEEVAVKAVKEAISKGYRHIDTAASYKNEKSIGRAIKECGVPREELFITSKVWATERGYEKTKASFEKSLKDLGLDYIDLFLIHWPASPNKFDNWKEINLDTWKALTELYKEGKVKAIGVSNFRQRHLEALMKTEVKPMVNQIEFNPGNKHMKTLDYCKNNKIQVEAWSPLGRARILDNEILVSLGKKYGKSPAQICLRWCLQNDVIPLPKSTTPSRIEENLQVFDFEIAEDDMTTINGMPSFGWSGLDPDEVDFHKKYI